MPRLRCVSFIARVLDIAPVFSLLLRAYWTFAYLRHAIVESSIGLSNIRDTFSTSADVDLLYQCIIY